LPPAAPSFQIAPGTQTSMATGPNEQWARHMQMRGHKDRFRPRKQAGAPDQYLVDKLQRIQSPGPMRSGRR
jgi:hypothetical protein